MNQIRIATIVLFLIMLTPTLFAQLPRQVTLTASTDIKRELFNYLLVSQQLDTGDDYSEVSKYMYQVDVLTATKISGVGIYKFGINSAHSSYNVVFRYRDKLIFPAPTTAITSGQLLKLLGNFLSYYPNSYTLEQQKQLAVRLIEIVEHQRYLETQEF